MSVADTHDVVSERDVVTVAAPRGRRWHVVRLLALSDILAALLAAGLSVIISDGGPGTENVAWIAISVVMIPIAFGFYSLYERDRRQIAISTLDEIRDVLNALGIAGFVQLAFGYGFGLSALLPNEALTVFFFWLFGLALVPTLRALLRSHVIPRAVMPQNTVILGAGMVGQTIARKILKHPEYNVRIVGFLDDAPEYVDPAVASIPMLGAESDLVDVIKQLSVQRVLLAFSRRTHEDVLEVIRNAGLRDVHVSIVPRYFEIIAANVGVGVVEGIPVLELPEVELSRFARWSKRVFDLVLTVPALIVLSPLMLVTAVAIKVDSPGPVFFRQARRGRHDRSFRIFKFRTMVHNAEGLRKDLLCDNESDGPLFKIKRDPRVTRVGRILRNYSLDEMPQLLNVVQGEMSLVGPRPFVVYEDDLIDGWARRRLDLTPGITGVWQVLGRNDIGYDEMVKLDYLYVTNWSLWWDIKLVLQTIPIIFGRRGY